MRGFAGYLLIGLVAALAMGLVTLAGLDFAVGARPMPEGGALIQHVDRTHKGDRLDRHTTTIGSRPVPKKAMTKVPVGCEPTFSPLVDAGNASIAGRCVS